MLRPMNIYDGIVAHMAEQDWIIPTLGRLLFAATLLMYFINSGLTKIGRGLYGILSPSVGAYVQILPKAFDAAGYDPSSLGTFQHIIVYAGILAEFVLPSLIVLGLFTRLAALGLIGFVIVQSLTDVLGHGQVDALGGWFDRFPDGTILDQRSFWVFVLLTLVIKGGGPFAVDRLAVLQTRRSQKSVMTKL